VMQKCIFHIKMHHDTGLQHVGCAAWCAVKEIKTGFRPAADSRSHNTPIIEKLLIINADFAERLI
jgi:hypothetical protein